ncbi:hypothetical protein SK803_32345 [Lentzea sp. BCCO 10_0856]|uniref:Uncharacterized protein n=1 Tax=Lentzea miocenica TaxID=3095431 RepID=A0ABU4T9U3_9PSEU|nr:hypothetical protein [Lentzea sp. BCCO 10_0856]MDX8034931.1 hypothetical protein [Lentzea sp. BCCO 10_0856]
MTRAMDLARTIADAVLYEGYLLYPYRASATKNRLRWQWGVLMPPSFTDGGEHPDSWAELVVVPDPDAVLHVRPRFLQLQERVAEVADGAGHRAVPSVTVAGREHTTWDEAVEREIDVVLRLADLIGADTRVPFEVDDGEDVEMIGGGARLVRRRYALTGELTLRADLVPPGLLRLRVHVRNTSAWEQPGSARNDALRHALIAAHVLLSVSAGGFLSLVDPPDWAVAAAGGCRNERTWPVLMGRPGRSDTVLCAPIILYDHPEIAEQSHGDMFDGTEIDELLTLRTMTLTDEEKRQVRATDARAAGLLDRVEGLSASTLEALHGTMRHSEPDAGGVPSTGEPPSSDPGCVLVGGAQVGTGSRVRLRPSRGADAQDMFLAGRVAEVRTVLSDVDGGVHLAVTLEDDEAADLLAECGLYRYFGPEEVEPL